MEFFRRNFVDRPIEELKIPFAAVSTALRDGIEVWLRSGSTVEAMRASIALPGLFTPALKDGMLLVDGGLVNPVPVSLARAMGADIVIAIDLGSDKLGRHLVRDSEPQGRGGAIGDWTRKLREGLDSLAPVGALDEPRLPSLISVLLSSLDIMEVRISRSRMAGDPPDILVAPRLANLHLLDFHRAREAINEGRRATEVVLSQITALLERV